MIMTIQYVNIWLFRYLLIFASWEFLVVTRNASYITFLVTTKKLQLTMQVVSKLYWYVERLLCNYLERLFWNTRIFVKSYHEYLKDEQDKGTSRFVQVIGICRLHWGEREGWEDVWVQYLFGYRKRCSSQYVRPPVLVSIYPIIT